MMFAMEESGRMKEENPDASNAEISSLLRAAWAELDENDRYVSTLAGPR